MIEVLESEYVQMARLKGIPEHQVIRRHALPNALVAVIQASALMLAYLLAGVVVVEYIFAYPGLGTGLTEAVGSRDLTVIQAITFIFAVAVVLFNMLADILTILVTPRLRTRAWGG
jgi:peptide/nickel transport system permease protein